MHPSERKVSRVLSSGMKATFLLLALHLAITLGTQLYAKPVIQHLQFRARTQTLEVYGKFDASTSTVRLNGRVLPTKSASDSLIYVSFDSTAAPWHGDVSVTDVTGASTLRRLSLYWLYFQEKYQFVAGTPMNDSRRFEAWVALPIDVLSVVNPFVKSSWTLEPLPVSKMSVGESMTEYANDGEVFTSGGRTSFLLPEDLSWTFGIYVYSGEKTLSVQPAHMDFSASVMYPSGESQNVSARGSYRGHPIKMDEMFDVIDGNLDYNYNPPDLRLEHLATWRQDSVLSPFDVNSLSVKLSGETPRTRVFPNPATDWVTLQVPVIDELEIQLVDQLGLTRKRHRLRSNETISVGDLPPGVYSVLHRGKRLTCIVKY